MHGCLEEGIDKEVEKEKIAYKIKLKKKEKEERKSYIKGNRTCMKCKNEKNTKQNRV